VLIDEKERGHGRPRRNHSAVNNDFMIGSGERLVTGITRDGDEVPIMSGGARQL
jgi:leucyl aminopeptidase (aminopeptidase T)